MPESISDEEWDKIEDRVLKNIPIGSITSEKEFKQQLISKFFGGWETRKQHDLGEDIWEDLADLYEEGAKKGKKEYVEINIREHPAEARRFTRAIKFYKNILKLFNKGYSRKDVSKHYARKTKRKQSTINRDISAFVKLGVISRYGKRAYYRSKKNVYV